MFAHPRTRWLAPVALLLCLLLDACGGGSAGAPTRAETAPPAIENARRHALFTLSDELIDESLWLLPAIEQLYPQYFPASAGVVTLRSGNIRYRCYPGGNCVGFDGTDLYAMGPVVNSLSVPVLVTSINGFCAGNARACGLTVPRTVQIQGITRHYLVYLPYKARGQSLTPTVFMLHGTTGTGAEFYANSGWREKADAEGLIAVFPTALRHCFLDDDDHDGTIEEHERQTPTRWAGGSLGGPTNPLCSEAQRASLPAQARAAVDHPLADDLAFFRAMVADVVARYGADPKRIYASGFSNGGQMASRLARDASDLFAAVAASAGTMDESLITPAPRAMSVAFMVGELDDRFTWRLPGGAIPLTQDLSGSAFFETIAGNFRAVLSLAPTPYTWQQVQLFGDDMSVYRYASSTQTPAAGNELYVAIVKGLTHSYPNYMPDLLWPWFQTKRLP